MTDPVRSALGRTPECPDLDVLLKDSRPANVEAHVKSCAHCLSEIALFHEFETAEPHAEEREDLAWIESRLERRSTAALPAAPSPSASLWGRAQSWLAAAIQPGHRGALALVAASLVAVTLGGLYLRQGRIVERPGPAETSVWRSGGFAALSPAGDVNEPPAEFRWEAVPGAASYELKLMEVDRTVIWTSETKAASVEIPNNIRAQFLPARAFSWQVTARGSGGELLGSTNLQTFHIPVTPK